MHALACARPCGVSDQIALCTLRQELVDCMHVRQRKSELDKLRGEIKSNAKDAIAGVAELERISMEGNLPLHWMWLEDAGVGFQEDEQYMEDQMSEEALHAGSVDPAAPQDHDAPPA